jgi:hypothetical protein
MSVTNSALCQPRLSTGKPTLCIMHVRSSLLMRTTNRPKYKLAGKDRRKGHKAMRPYISVH